LPEHNCPDAEKYEQIDSKITRHLALFPGSYVVLANSGLGSVFNPGGTRGKFHKGVVQRLYVYAYGHRNLHAIFLNPEDRAVILRLRTVKEAQTSIIPGSGVDLAAYQAKPEPDVIPLVIFTARLLRDKGVFEFVGAARIQVATQLSRTKQDFTYLCATLSRWLL
jgi:hypothetical protein